ncbi:MAG: DUF4391 domain-containing protein [Candidatus Margulisbacteria bacterium]|jgi:hypothetical protein|nr:DUF4391 domain-containing protein [Candidatus Margulisiibacteriota bacterium]
MLGLSCSTEVNRRVAKEKLYANAAWTPQSRKKKIKDQRVDRLAKQNAVCENLARRIAGGRLDINGDIAGAVDRDKQW